MSLLPHPIASRLKVAGKQAPYKMLSCNVNRFY
jgi:hypothetical protein